MKHPMEGHVHPASYWKATVKTKTKTLTRKTGLIQRTRAQQSLDGCPAANQSGGYAGHRFTESFLVRALFNVHVKATSSIVLDRRAEYWLDCPGYCDDSNDNQAPRLTVDDDDDGRSQDASPPHCVNGLSTQPRRA